MRSVVKRNVHFLGISRFSHSLLLVLLSPVVQFSMINSLSRAHSRAHSLGIIPHLIRFVKGFFKSFLKNFFRGLCPRSRPLVDSLHIIALSFGFVKRFLTKKSDSENCLIWAISADRFCAGCTQTPSDHPTCAATAEDFPHSHRLSSPHPHGYKPFIKFL